MTPPQSPIAPRGPNARFRRPCRPGARAREAAHLAELLQLQRDLAAVERAIRILMEYQSAT